MKRRHIYILSLLIFGLCLVACDSKELSAYSGIDSEGWAYGDTIDLDLGAIRLPADTVWSQSGNMSLVVRHDNNYEFSNLWLQLVYKSADSTVVDTINMPLADVYGKWLGRGIGVSFQCILPIGHMTDLDLRHPVQVSHIMRADSLPHIEQIGVVFEPDVVTPKP